MSTVHTGTGVDAPVPARSRVSSELDAAIQARLGEITAPDYVDPARRDFTTWDWVAFVGFLAACTIGFTVWGY